MKKLLKIKRSEKGQSLVEFALILPILLLLILGIIQFSIIFSSQIAITNAAREGARVAAVGSSKIEIVERINHSIGGHVFLPEVGEGDVIVEWGAIGGEVTVTIKGITLKLFVPVPEVFVTNSEVTLGGKASMRLEKNPD